DSGRAPALPARWAPSPPRATRRGAAWRGAGRAAPARGRDGRLAPPCWTPGPRRPARPASPRNANRLGDTGKAARQVPQHRGDFLELARRPLQLGQPARRLTGARCHVVGLGAVLPGDRGYRVDPRSPAPERLALPAPGRRDAPRLAGRLRPR